MAENRQFYLMRAEESARDAASAELDNVRERCLRAERAWRAMADRSERNEAQREQQAREKADRAASAF